MTTRKSGYSPQKAAVKLIERLMEGRCSIDELRRVSTLQESTIRRWVASFREHGGNLIRIAGRSLPNPTNGAQRLLYQWNPQRLPDAAIPPKLSPAQRQRNRRQRLREAAFDAQVQQLITRGIHEHTC